VQNNSSDKHRLAIFASGTGSNARVFVDYFDNHPRVEVSLIVSNKADAPVLEMARQRNIDTLLLQRSAFYGSEDLLDELHHRNISFIVLAGFLWLVPAYLVKAFAGRMVNIHPALLPAYGGKGMYGMHVHTAVKAAAGKETGITIHWVNEHYDEGDVIFQKSCLLEDSDQPADIARKVLQLEHQYYTAVVEQLLVNNFVQTDYTK
jgi:phosphoribosylglycinamide formyltransferase 1